MPKRKSGRTSQTLCSVYHSGCYESKSAKIPPNINEGDCQLPQQYVVHLWRQRRRRSHKEFLRLGVSWLERPEETLSTRETVSVFSGTLQRLRRARSERAGHVGQSSVVRAGCGLEWGLWKKSRGLPLDKCEKTQEEKRSKEHLAMISMKAAGTRPDSPRTLARYLMMVM